MPIPRAARLQSLLPVLLALVLALALAYRMVAHWQVLEAGAVAAPPKGATVAGPPADGAVDYAGIAALHLFGTVSAATATAPSQQAVRETTLPLTLHGVLLEPGISAAIIGSGGAQHYVRLGGELPGGGVLREVAADRIVFERGGRREALRLPRAGGDAPPANPAPGSG